MLSSARASSSPAKTAVPGARVLDFAAHGDDHRGVAPVSPEPVAFSTSFEALLVHGLGKRVDEALRAKFLRLGLDLNRLAAAYPLEVWRQALELAASRIYKGKPPDDAMFQLGCDFIRGLQQTAQGKALFDYGRVVGPDRMVPRMTSNFRSSNNYLDTELETVGPGNYVLSVFPKPEMIPKLRGPISPHYMRGILTQCVTDGGAGNVLVRLEGGDPARRLMRYRITFTFPKGSAPGAGLP